MNSIKTTLCCLAIAAITFVFSCKKNDSAPAGPPTISTNTITNITTNSATGGGFAGDSSTYYRITGRGIIYSSVGDPLPLTIRTQTYDYLNAPNIWGSYPSYMTGLTPNTTYYVRAYLDWEPVGTTMSNYHYGDLRTFKTLP